MERTPAAAAAPSPTAQTWRPTVTVVAAIAAIAALMPLAEGLLAERLPDAAGHGLSHFVVALPMGMLLFAALFRWPPARATRPGRLGRRLVVVGLAGVVIGQLLEVVGARVDEPGALAMEGGAHTAGQIVTMLSLPVLLVGTLASLLAAAREGDVPWWVVVLVAIGAAGLLGFMMIGAPDGS